MRLVDLHPRWSGERDGERKLGILFDCPCAKCLTLPSELATWNYSAMERTDDPHGAVIYVNFLNPIGGGLPFVNDKERPGPYWTRTGEDFATLTLSPSIAKLDHWHGYVRDGWIVNA